MLEKLKREVWNANLELVRRGVVTYTWGNVSGVDRKEGFMVIKPSGIDYSNMKPVDMVVISLDSGVIVEGKCKPSSDTPTHLALYRAFPGIGGIAHTHSINAVAFAQAGMDIPILGTTQADYFCGSIPCTRELTSQEVGEAYEANTGKIIIEKIKEKNVDLMTVPGIVVRNHGPFTWGKDASESVYHAVVLETVAEMNLKTLFLNPQASIQKHILDKHYLRKHGSNAYYGQK